MHIIIIIIIIIIITIMFIRTHGTETTTNITRMQTTKCAIFMGCLPAY